MKAKCYDKSELRGEYRVEVELKAQMPLPGLPAPETADVRAGAPSKKRGRLVTGCAVPAAERMRRMRARRKAQPSLFSSQVQAGVVEAFQVAPVTKKKRVTKKAKPTERELLRQRLVENVEAYQYHRYGNPYQKHCAFFERGAVVESLAKLGGMAGEW